MDWNEKALARKLLSVQDHQRVAADLQRLPKSINALIKYTGNALKE